MFGSKKGFKVQSFGTGSAVKLPGTGPSQPNVYSFETTYEHMYQDLQQKDAQLYPFRCANRNTPRFVSSQIEKWHHFYSYLKPPVYTQAVTFYSSSIHTLFRCCHHQQIVTGSRCFCIPIFLCYCLFVQVCVRTCTYSSRKTLIMRASDLQ